MTASAYTVLKRFEKMIDILVVEDNIEISELLCDFLRAEGFTVSLAHSGEKALELFEKYGAKLVILDVMLPGIDGFAVCQKIRETENTPILIVSARITKEDKLNGLILGADDYIEKPFDIDIMVAKIRGIFRRRYESESITCGDIVLDKVRRTVSRRGTELKMTAKEIDLLELLMENKGATLSKDMLFSRIWGFDSDSETQTLTVHIKWLREKIEDDPKKPRHILTVWGVGYRFEEGVSDESLQ